MRIVKAGAFLAALFVGGLVLMTPRQAAAVSCVQDSCPQPNQHCQVRTVWNQGLNWTCECWQEGGPYVGFCAGGHP